MNKLVVHFFVTIGLLFTSTVTAQEVVRYRTIPSDGLLKRWNLLGPIRPEKDGSKDADFFADDPIDGGSSKLHPQERKSIESNGKEILWRTVHSEDGIIDLAKNIEPLDHASCYAYAEISSSEDQELLLDVASDDAVKIWVNGKLIHDHWTQRTLSSDHDLVEANLHRGTNRLLLRVHNATGDWKFSCQLVVAKALVQRLVEAAGSGDLAGVELALKHGADINGKSRRGFTAWQFALRRGYKEIAKHLEQAGARTDLPMPPAAEYFDNILSEQFGADGPACAVLVSRDGKVIYSRAFGRRDIENNLAADLDTKFRIGSVTKQFTGAAILKLQEAGKLNVNDKLSKYVPDFQRGDEITIHHLLTHTSGIFNYTSKPQFMQEVTTPIKPKDLIDSFKNDDLVFNPGDQWSYSNSGYFLLGYIVEQVSGKSYAEFLRDEFFEPLGMSHSGVHSSSLELENEAKGYSSDSSGVVKSVNWDMSRAGGAGAIYSTVGDLNTWNEALFAGKVLSKESMKLALTPAKLNNGDETGYGYGWGIAEHRGLPTIAHSGGLHGFLCNLARYTDQNLTIAVSMNIFPSSEHISPGAITSVIAETLLWEQMGERVVPVELVDADNSDFDKFVGRYDYRSAIMEVTYEDGKLYAQLTGQPRFQIYPKGEDIFFWKVVEAQVKFVMDKDGKVAKAVHTQSGQTFDAPRLPDVVVVELTAEQLEEYVGKYDYGKALGELVVTREGNRLFAQLSSQPKFEIIPTGKDKFEWRVVAASVKFVRDKDGKIVKGIHSQGGGTINAPKVE